MAGAQVELGACFRAQSALNCTHSCDGHPLHSPLTSTDRSELNNVLLLLAKAQLALER
jgi:hypothetical protein